MMRFPTQVVKKCSRRSLHSSSSLAQANDTTPVPSPRPQVSHPKSAPEHMRAKRTEPKEVSIGGIDFTAAIAAASRHNAMYTGNSKVPRFRSRAVEEGGISVGPALRARMKSESGLDMSDLDAMVSAQANQSERTARPSRSTQSSTSNRTRGKSVSAQKGKGRPDRKPSAFKNRGTSASSTLPGAVEKLVYPKKFIDLVPGQDGKVQDSNYTKAPDVRSSLPIKTIPNQAPTYSDSLNEMYRLHVARNPHLSAKGRERITKEIVHLTGRGSSATVQATAQ